MEATAPIWRSELVSPTVGTSKEPSQSTQRPDGANSTSRRLQTVHAHLTRDAESSAMPGGAPPGCDRVRGDRGRGTHGPCPRYRALGALGCPGHVAQRPTQVAGAASHLRPACAASAIRAASRAARRARARQPGTDIQGALHPSGWDVARRGEPARATTCPAPAPGVTAGPAGGPSRERQTMDASGPTGQPDRRGAREPERETMAVRGGRRHNAGSLATPLWATSVFEQGSLEEMRKLGARPRPERFYSRYANPTVTAFEDAVAELEGAEAALAFASGMGAVFATVFGLCSRGSHVVAQQQMYGGTLQLLRGVCPRMGIDVTFVDATRPGAFAEAVEPGRTTLVLAETPANPCLDLVDLDELAGLQGPITAVDATFATPLGLRPLEHGVSLSIHSATKAMAGHNDATLGVVSGERDLVDWLWGFATVQGATPSPFDALNGLRGLRTLGVRLRQQTETALALAAALEAHPRVANVRHPGLASHPQHELARRQLRVTGGLVSFDLGGYGAACAFVDALRLCRLAPSLGGPETLITHPASTSHAGLGPEELAEAGISVGTVRLSAGLEATADVLADVLGAVDAAAGLEDGAES
ncbi:MAG: hypothetical protein GEV08_15370 [Acidimicrobiia bacterium]|nr:hypothetical protein [Acidimicrobiia bacterium]